MQPSQARDPRLLGVVGIGILQAGLSLYLSWLDLDILRQNPAPLYAWQLPFDMLSILVAVAALIALYLIVRQRRFGLKLGLSVWAASSILTVFFVLMVNAPYPAMRNYFFVNGAISLFVNLAVMYVFAHYLSRPRDKSAFK